jgi:hypothetical protein
LIALCPFGGDWASIYVWLRPWPYALLRLVVGRSGRAATRSAIPEPLADDAGHGPLGPLYVIDADADPVRVPEIELRKVSVKVLLLAVLIYTRIPRLKIE